MQTNIPKEFFEIALPQQFNPANAVGIDVVVQITVVGDHGGNWTITIKDQKIETKEGTTEAPALALNMAEKDFMDLVNKRISAERAFFSGKVRFKGNITLALKLRDAGFL
jgi:putative sterol carrier protein